MSSLARRVQIRALKRSGYRRSKIALERRADGKVHARPARRGGLIFDAKGNMLGRHWPGAARPYPEPVSPDRFAAMLAPAFA